MGGANFVARHEHKACETLAVTRSFAVVIPLLTAG